MVCSECPICYEDIKNNVNKVILCKNKHSMHKSCYLNFTKSKARKICPYCRDKLKICIIKYAKYMKSTVSSRNKKRCKIYI
jgi:hypothetical protein